MQAEHCPWQTLPPHGQGWPNSWLQQQVSAKWGLGSSSCYHGPSPTQRILNLLEYLQKVKPAPNFSKTDSAGFTKMQSVPPHRQKGSHGGRAESPKFIGAWIWDSQTSGSQSSQNQILPWLPWVKNSQLKRRLGKATQFIYCRCLKQFLLCLQKKCVGLWLRVAPIPVSIWQQSECLSRLLQKNPDKDWDVQQKFNLQSLLQFRHEILEVTQLLITENQETFWDTLLELNFSSLSHGCAYGPFVSFWKL